MPPGSGEEENADDAVCQVCFDGDSVESNPIVFCDKCNIAIHKVGSFLLVCQIGGCCCRLEVVSVEVALLCRDCCVAWSCWCTGVA